MALVMSPHGSVSSIVTLKRNFSAKLDFSTNVKILSQRVNVKVAQTKGYSSYTKALLGMWHLGLFEVLTGKFYPKCEWPNISGVNILLHNAT